MEMDQIVFNVKSLKQHITCYHHIIEVSKI